MSEQGAISMTVVGRCQECGAIRYAEVEPAEAKRVGEAFNSGLIVERLSTVEVRQARWSHLPDCSRNRARTRA